MNPGVFVTIIIGQTETRIKHEGTEFTEKDIANLCVSVFLWFYFKVGGPWWMRPKTFSATVSVHIDSSHQVAPASS